MKANLKILFCFGILGVQLMAGVNAALADGSAHERLDEVFQKRPLPVKQSIFVQSLSDGGILYQKNPDQLVTPASVTKVITSAAALALFGPANTFSTGFYYTGKRQGSKIKGDLVVVGDGDPFVVSELLWQLAADIKHLGIREFTGNIIIDNDLFDGEARDEPRKVDEAKSNHAYDAPVSAFGVNFNTFAVAVAPAEEEGKPGLIGIDPYDVKGVRLENHVKTGNEAAKTSLSVERKSPKNRETTLTVTGAISVKSGVKKIYRSVGNQVLASGEFLRSFLGEAGIKVHGKVLEGSRPSDAKPLVDLQGYEMRRIVAGLNTFSNNYIADVLTKRLGAAFPKEGEADVKGSGTLANGLGVMSRFLMDDVGIKSSFVLKNGSGLNTDNRLTASQVVAVLSYMEKRMDVFPEFFASFPASGWDGTLKKRFAKGDASALKGLFRAKTGTLTAPITVASIAGYFRHPKHGLVAFAVLENGEDGKKQPSVVDLRERQDELLSAMMNGL